MVASAHGTGADQPLFDAADAGPHAEAFQRRNGCARDGEVDRRMDQGADMVTVWMVR